MKIKKMKINLKKAGGREKHKFLIKEAAKKFILEGYNVELKL